MPVTTPERRFEARETMRADCSRCAGLCCVALAFRASTEFAADKAAGVPCPHLVGDRLCDIHDRLRSSGYRGCAAFDCFGAGQHVTQVTFPGRRWRDDPDGAGTIFAVFDVMRRLKELLWHLADAASAGIEGPLAEEVRAMRTTVEDLTYQGADDLEHLDVIALQQNVMKLLQAASKAARDDLADGSELELATADLSGADLSRVNLRGADLRFARLCNAVLTGADLFGADLFGADLTNADVRGARLQGSLFLTRLQLEVTIGDSATTVPPALGRPDHWSWSTRDRASLEAPDL